MKLSKSHVTIPLAMVLMSIGLVVSLPLTTDAKENQCNRETDYCPSPLQNKVDRSFSNVPITTLFSAVSHPLEDVSDACFPGECERRNASGVRHYFYEDELVSKNIRADEFGDRPIAALGIGSARRMGDVMANIGRYIPDASFDCTPGNVSGNVGPVECRATMNPGWVQIGFDRRGNLIAIRFDGYHWT